MKILVISNLYPPYILGGYEIHCAQKVEGLKQRGHDVTVLTSDYGVDYPKVEDNIYRSLPYVPERHKLKTWSLLKIERKAVSTIQHIVNETKPDVIYIWNMWSIPPSVPFFVERTKIGIVYQIDHNWLLEGYSRDPWLARWKSRTGLTKYVFQLIKPLMKYMNIVISVDELKLRRIIFVSHYRQQEHLKSGRDVEATQVIYNGCIVPEVIENLDGHSPLRKLLYIARYMTPAKGVLTAVKAVQRLVETGYPDISLDVIGEFFPGQEDYRDEVCKIADLLKNNIRFFGFFSREQVLNLYPQYDILLFCANSPEGLPLTVVEAMACGIPVIGSPVGGAEEILRPEASLTFTPDDDVELAKCIRRLCNDPVLWRKLSSGALNLVRQEFSATHSLELTEAVLLAQIKE